MRDPVEPGLAEAAPAGFEARSAANGLAELLGGLTRLPDLLNRLPIGLHIEDRDLRSIFVDDDLDPVKSVSDTHGHAVGDTVLRQVAARCRDALGDAGLLGRLGDEDFAACCPLADDVGPRTSADICGKNSRIAWAGPRDPAEASGFGPSSAAPRSAARRTTSS